MKEIGFGLFLPESDRMIVVWTNGFLTGTNWQVLSTTEDVENSLGGGGNSIESDSSDDIDSSSSSSSSFAKISHTHFTCIMLEQINSNNGEASHA